MERQIGRRGPHGSVFSPRAPVAAMMSPGALSNKGVAPDSDSAAP